MKFLGIVSLSGGIDSSTVLAHAVRDCGRGNVTAVSIDYGQRHIKELEQAKKVAQYLLGDPNQHVILKIGTIGKGGLTDHDATIPNISYGEITGVSPTYVPFRNGLILSTLASYAVEAVQRVQKWEDSRAVNEPPEIWKARVYFGAHAEDAAGDAYPDCRLDFVGAMGAAIHIGTYGEVEVAAPIIQMYKDEIVLHGQKLGVPWHLTWSCYKGEQLHCGVCPTCRARKAGFAKAEVGDPTEYADPVDQYPFKGY